MCIAKYEIKQILIELDKDIEYFENIFKRFREIWDSLRPNLVYKDSEILVPLVICFYFRFQEVPLDSFYLIEVSKIDV